MLLREEGEGAWVITQTVHSWLTGELGRAWGGGVFDSPEPAGELITAATLHDFGYARWAQAPVWNPNTGFPYDYKTLPHDEHLAIWREGIGAASTLSRTAALLISLHSIRLYALYHRAEDHTPEEIASMAVYREQEWARQQALLASLAKDTSLKGAISSRSKAERLARLLGTWDFLSHLLCEAIAEFTLDEVPTTEGDLTIHGRLEKEDQCLLSPWPFVAPMVTVRFEARWLPQVQESQQALESALRAASYRSFAVRVTPG